MDLLYALILVVAFFAVFATYDLLTAGRSAARNAFREAFARGEIGEDQYAAGLRALTETA